MLFPYASESAVEPLRDESWSALAAAGGRWIGSACFVPAQKSMGDFRMALASLLTLFFLATWTLTDEGTRLLSVIDLGSKVESPKLCWTSATRHGACGLILARR